MSLLAIALQQGGMSRRQARRAAMGADLSVTVTRSAGKDHAVLVFIDSAFEPDGSDEGPGLRAFVNDVEVYVGKDREWDEHDRPCASVRLDVALEQIEYES